MTLRSDFIADADGASKDLPVPSAKMVFEASKARSRKA
jgi:hypothetical protein